VRRRPAWQEAHINTVSILRYVQDQQMAALAAGETVDPRDIASIGAQLQEALRPAFTTGSGDAERENENAREKLADLVMRARAANEYEEAQTMAETMQREEMAAIAAAQLP
jgi:uncharacterized protein (DUF1501 family)